MARLQTEYVDLGDIHVAYHQAGSGRTLLLLHGNSGSKRLFRSYQLKHFSMFHTIAVDSRGHDQSRSNDDQLTYDQISEDVLRFCQAKGIQEAFVIGYSDGGNVALLLAKKAPQMFPRIVAISLNYLVSGITDSALHFLQRILNIMTFFQKIGFNLKKHQMRFELMMHDIGITEEELRSIQTEVKIIYADNDLIMEDHLQGLAGFIPNASLTKIRGCNHFTILNKKETIALIKDFLLDNH
jgi:pimeloyl-ACP methyl ester carboxylesterase